jgi:hypothetical protein
MTDPTPDRTPEDRSLDRLVDRARTQVDDQLQPAAPEVGDLLRRGRRRQAGRTVALAAAVLVVLALAVSVLRGSDDGTTHLAADAVSTTTTSPAKLTIVPSVDWDQAVLLRDDRTLRIPVGSDRKEDSACFPTYRMEVLQHDDAVTVAFAPWPDSSSAVGQVCPGMGLSRSTEVVLAEPLGDRVVLNGISPEPRQVERWSALVELGYVPKGFRDSGVNSGGEEHPGFQQIMFDGPWFLSVYQRPEGTAKAPPKGAVPITVRGHDGFVFASFNGSTVQWSEGGYDLAVTGEGAEEDRVTGSLSGATTYVPEAELLKVAEGLELPDRASGPGASSTTTSTTSAPAFEDPRGQDAAVVSGVLQLVGGPPGTEPQPVEGMVTFHGPSTISANVGEDGTFQTTLPPGSYDVTGLSPKYQGAQGTCTTTNKLQVEAREKIQDLKVNCPTK